PPVGPHRYRLVFDLYPAVAPDPLMDLLTQTEHKEQRLNEGNQTQAPSLLSGPGLPPAATGDNSDAFFQRYAQNMPPDVPRPSARATPAPTPRPTPAPRVPSKPAVAP